MNLQKIQPRESLNKAFLKINPFRTESQRKTIEKLLQKCLDANGKDVKNIETEIDQLYELTAEEIKIIENT